MSFRHNLGKALRSKSSHSVSRFIASSTSIFSCQYNHRHRITPIGITESLDYVYQGHGIVRSRLAGSWSRKTESIRITWLLDHVFGSGAGSSSALKLRLWVDWWFIFLAVTRHALATSKSNHTSVVGILL